MYILGRKVCITKPASLTCCLSSDCGNESPLLDVVPLRTLLGSLWGQRLLTFSCVVSQSAYFTEGITWTTQSYCTTELLWQAFNTYKVANTVQDTGQVLSQQMLEACLMVSPLWGDSSKHHMLVPLPLHVLFKSYGSTTEVQQTDTRNVYSLMNLNTCIHLTLETIPTVKIMNKSVIPSPSPCGFKIQPF